MQREWAPLVRHVLLVAALAALRAAPLQGQGITLPTVRTFGPGPEEGMMYRLFRDLRRTYASDTSGRDSTDGPAVAPDSGAVARARLALPRLDRIVLAGLKKRQYAGLVRAASRVDSLAILADDRGLPDDPLPQLLLESIRRVASDTASCRNFTAAEQQKMDTAAYRQVAALPTTRRATSDTTEARRRTARINCATRELRERDPALMLGAVKLAEEEAQRFAIAAKLDSLTRVTTAVVILRKISVRTFAPLHNRRQAEAFWRQRGMAPLNVGSISGSGKTGASFTELASPLLQMIRVSVNAVLAAEKDEESSPPAANALDAGDPNAAVQRLLTGGGLFNVSLAWPVAYKGWYDGTLDVMSIIVPRFGLTAPVLGAVGADSTTLNLDLGLELHAKYVDPEDGVGVVTQLRLANARGSRNFVESLGVPAKHNVTYATASFGFLFGKQYLVTASRAIGGPQVIRRSPWQVGLTVVRLPASQ